MYWKTFFPNKSQQERVFHFRNVTFLITVLTHMRSRKRSERRKNTIWTVKAAMISFTISHTLGLTHHGRVSIPWESLSGGRSGLQPNCSLPTYLSSFFSMIVPTPETHKRAVSWSFRLVRRNFKPERPQRREYASKRPKPSIILSLGSGQL